MAISYIDCFKNARRPKFFYRTLKSENKDKDLQISPWESSRTFLEDNNTVYSDADKRSWNMLAIMRYQQMSTVTWSLCRPVTRPDDPAIVTWFVGVCILQYPILLWNSSIGLSDMAALKSISHCTVPHVSVVGLSHAAIQWCEVICVVFINTAIDILLQEMFVQELTREAYTYTMQGKRKTLQPRDLGTHFLLLLHCRVVLYGLQ